MLQIHKNVLSKDFCEHLIKKFDELEKDTTHSMFDQIEMKNIEIWKNELYFLLKIVDGITEKYCSIFDPFKLMPQKNRVEGFRIKRYEPNKHRFPLHVDASNIKTCTRYLAFLFYLNDNEAGTKFHDYANSDVNLIEAKQGNVLIFPPMWMFPHEGLMPTKTPKYIMSTYLHFV